MIVRIYGPRRSRRRDRTPIVDDTVTQHIDSHSIFWINVPISVVAVFLVLSLLPKAIAHRRRLQPRRGQARHRPLSSRSSSHSAVPSRHQLVERLGRQNTRCTEPCSASLGPRHRGAHCFEPVGTTTPSVIKQRLHDRRRHVTFLMSDALFRQQTPRHRGLPARAPASRPFARRHAPPSVLRAAVLVSPLADATVSSVEPTTDHRHSA